LPSGLGRTLNWVVWPQELDGVTTLCSCARHFTFTLPLSNHVYKGVEASYHGLASLPWVTLCEGSTLRLALTLLCRHLIKAIHPKIKVTYFKAENVNWKGKQNKTTTKTVDQPTLNGHLNQYLADTWSTSLSTPDQHFTDSQLIAGQVLTNSFILFHTQCRACEN